MRALLLPIKDQRNAKQRLAGLLSPEERQSLARAMMEDVLTAVRSVRRAEQIFVVTNFAPAIRIAESAGWHVLLEEEQISESASVDFASRCCAERGVSALLRLPMDLPLVQPADIDELLALDFSAPAAVMVPSSDGTGTNALLRTPPALFPSQFGSGSFAKHRALAESAGAQILLRRNPRLEMDVDDPDDLRALLTHDLSATATGRWLAASGVAARVSSSAQSLAPAPTL
ncbi:MAG: 2-phospho-L-lactate guanylyltransferase [Acidobacteriia bacterium]|nr:2-phospho-L-lactate guanylyltransferase [Terriglobia bacterium]